MLIIALGEYCITDDAMTGVGRSPGGMRPYTTKQGDPQALMCPWVTMHHRLWVPKMDVRMPLNQTVMSGLYSKQTRDM